MGDRLRVGIIGCGALGEVHARRFSEMEGAEVVALSDPNEESMAHVARSLPGPASRLSADYREILDSGLDAICIASPDIYHVPQVLDSLAANLHVLCEKPLTLEPGDLEAVIASRDEVGKHVVMTYPRRYDPGLRAVRREIRSGKWGRVQTVSVYNCEDWTTGITGTWRHDPAICPGGFLFDANGHQIDTVFWLTGLEPLEVSAETDNRGTRIPLAGWGTAKLTGGVPMTFCFVGTARRWREQINIHCEGMDFFMDNGRSFWAPDHEKGNWAPVEPVPTDYEKETADHAFVNLIRGQGPNWSPPDEVWSVLLFTRALLESARTGRPAAASR